MTKGEFKKFCIDRKLAVRYCGESQTMYVKGEGSDKALRHIVSSKFKIKIQ